MPPTSLSSSFFCFLSLSLCLLHTRGIYNSKLQLTLILIAIYNMLALLGALQAVAHSSDNKPCDMGAVIIPIVQMKKFRLE